MCDDDSIGENTDDADPVLMAAEKFLYNRVAFPNGLYGYSSP